MSAIPKSVSSDSIQSEVSCSSERSSHSSGSGEAAHLVFEQNVQGVQAKDKVRMGYLRKLSGEGVWVPPEQRAPKHQDLIIFDWDDTLMYTSFLLRQKGAPIRPETLKHLERIEKAAYTLLETAVGLAQTFIITNAMEGWVEQCVAQHMPSLKKLLKRVPVISARSTQEGEGYQVSQWKNQAFMELGKRFDSQTITNVLSMGDSNYEMEAAHVLGEQFPQSVIKTVKMQESPSPEELMKQLDMIVPKFQAIVEKASNMKIRLERKRN